MHAFLKQALPEFEWLTLPGFLNGLVESFFFGAYASLVFAPVHNFFARRLRRGTS